MNKLSSNQIPLTESECAIAGGSWILPQSIVQQLDAFFLLHDTWDSIKDDIRSFPEQYRFALEEGGKLYTVVLKNSVKRLAEAEDIGLSFRRCEKAHLGVVLIKVWKKDSKGAQ